MSQGENGKPRAIIRCGDCIKQMQKMEAESVDLVFADPPFNIGYRYDVYDDGKAPEDYLRWCTEWLEEVYRILKPDGTFWLAIGDEMAAELKLLAQGQQVSSRSTSQEPGESFLVNRRGGFRGFYTRSWVLWYYTFGVACSKSFARSHTHLLYFTKHKSRFTFNHDDRRVRVPSARQLVYNDKRANPKGKLPDNVWVLSPVSLEKAFDAREDTWLASRVCGTFREREDDAANQMPRAIMERIVLSTSRPGDLVVDPFGGTFTTGEAAVRYGRHFTGFDISSKYCQRGRKRLRKAATDFLQRGEANNDMVDEK